MKAKFDEAFFDGYAQYPCPQDMNPYEDGTSAAGSWIDGWLTAKADDAKVVKAIERLPGEVDAAP